MAKTRIALVEIDGRVARIEVPEGTTPAQAEAMAQQVVPKQSAKPTSFWHGVAEGVVRPAANAAHMVARTNPILGAIDTLTGKMNPIDAAQAVMKDRLSKSPVRGSTLGRFAGEVLGTAPTMAIPGAGWLGALGQGAAGGAMLSDINNPRDVLKNAALGAAGGVIGQQAGKRVVAPILNRVGRIPGVRQGAEALASQANRVLPKRIPLPPKAPKLNTPERMVGRMKPEVQAIRSNAQDAARLGLPYAMADASPQLRALGGSVSRFSPDARAIAERNFNPRALGQADRAVSGIDSLLAPVTNIEERGANIRNAAQAVSRPLYEQAFAQPAQVDDALAAILNTPAGSAALAKASDIAANEGKVFDITAIKPGQPVPFETMDLVKRGLDSVLNDKRNPLTGKLDLAGDPLAGSINGLRQRLVNNLDESNPAYAQARAAYQEQIARKTALENGVGLARNSIPERQFNEALGTANDMTRPELQRGYATAMADQVDRQRLSGNPYNAVYGSPLQQNKVATMFPEGSQDFNRLYNLENDMAMTRNEVLGGSQTQPRNIADQMFQGGIASDAADMGIQALTGGGVPGATKALGAMLRYAKDRGQLGLIGAQRKADALAPTLFDTSNPQSIVDFLDELARKKAEEEARKKAYANAAGLLGLPASAAAVGLAQ